LASKTANLVRCQEMMDCRMRIPDSIVSFLSLTPYFKDASDQSLNSYLNSVINLPLHLSQDRAYFSC
jgi:hypothetical protein